MRFTVGPEWEGRLLRAFLRAEGVSAALLARLKTNPRGILQNGTRVTVRAVLRAGDVLDLAVEDETRPPAIPPAALPLRILAETADYLALDKPSGMPTHPSHGHHTDTLANALVYRFATEGAVFRPRFVNRLDRETSGVVLTARHALAAAALSRDMAAGRFRKTYLALAAGRVETRAVVETGIRRVGGSVILRETCPAGEGDFARTIVEPLLPGETASLVRLLPETGRTHQLRVHMAALGHPLLGDGLYGRAGGPIDRTALHAARLDFPDPRSGAPVSVRAPLPDDLRRCLTALLGAGAADLAEAAAGPA